jgi:hypothetical protein
MKPVHEITLHIPYSPQESQFVLRAVQAAIKAHRDYQSTQDNTISPSKASGNAHSTPQPEEAIAPPISIT